MFAENSVARCTKDDARSLSANSLLGWSRPLSRALSVKRMTSPKSLKVVAESLVSMALSRSSWPSLSAQAAGVINTANRNAAVNIFCL